MRTFEQTHPWISFRVDLSRLPFDFWIRLGSIDAQCEHLAQILIPPQVAQQLRRIYLAKGVQATTAIEGNTLTEEEILARIERTAPELPVSKRYLGIEVDNVIAACNAIHESVLTHPDMTGLTPLQICQFNRWVLQGLELPEYAQPGSLRNVSVGGGRYRGAPAEDCPYLLDRLCQWLDVDLRPPAPELRIPWGVLRAILAHLYLAWIHPFGDGNGRTARLMEFQLLLEAGVPDIAAHLLSNHYNQTRMQYYRQLERASQSGGDVLPFLNYAIQGMADGLLATFEDVRAFQREVAWRDFIDQRFPSRTVRPVGRRVDATQRQRTLALALWSHPQGVTAAEIVRLTPILTELYINLTSKTLGRDLEGLVAQGLLLKDAAHRYTPNVQVLQSLYPRQRNG